LIAADTNLLVYAHREETPHHGAALARLTEMAEGSRAWGLPVFCLGEFLRVTTHPKLFSPPSTLETALGFLGGVLGSPSVRLLFPGDRHWPLLADACREGDARGNLVFDAQIVALLHEHGIEDIRTEDRDFDRFPRIRVLPVSERRRR
jgi:toxin-antitoxin system PIN domain toxin